MQTLRDDFRAFLSDKASDVDLAVSLTMKQQDGPTTLDQFEATKNMRFFLNRLNKAAFGNAAVRFHRKLHVVPILERSLAGRLHYHLAMKDPFEDIEVCACIIDRCWSQTRWGYDEIDIQPIHDLNGWYKYITKHRNIDVWDIENTQLNR